MHPHDHQTHHHTDRRPEGRRFRFEDDVDGPGDRRPGRGGRGRGGLGGPGFGPGSGPGFGPGFGPDGPDDHHHGPHGFGPRRGGRRGGRARGDVRAAVLLLLAEQPRHGYELIQEIAERSGGTWTPSPGSIYPTLLGLEDEGLVTVEKVAGRKTASLTDDGVAYVEQQRDSLGTPWEATGGGPALQLRREILALKDAAAQVARIGTPAQHSAAATVLAAARRDLYRLLSEDTTPS